MTISVLVPTYNGAQHLPHAIDSILNQSYTDFEVIICDDGSIDNTWKVITDYAKKDRRIKAYQNNRNLGLVGNWNRCVELSNYDWIKFLFQDDLMDSDCLLTFQQHFDSRYPLIFSNRRFIYSSDVPISVSETYEKLPTFETFFSKNYAQPDELIDTILTNTRFRNFLGEPSSCILHRSVFDKFGLFNPELAQFCDLEYWHRVGINTGVKYISDTLSSFRVHLSSASSSNKLDFRAEYLDELVMLYSWCFDSNYHALRQRVRVLNIDIKKELYDKAFWLANHVEEVAKSNPKSLDSWNDVAKQHPRLVRSIPIYQRKIRHWFRNRLLWRLQ